MTSTTQNNTTILIKNLSMTFSGYYFYDILCCLKSTHTYIYLYFQKKKKKKRNNKKELK